jgi:hypothetical protein
MKIKDSKSINYYNVDENGNVIEKSYGSGVYYAENATFLGRLIFFTKSLLGLIVTLGNFLYYRSE